MLYTSILILHIIAGFVALISGGISFTAQKGRRLHNNSGKIYTIAMIAVGLSAITMCLMRYSPFLFTIGVFSTYMTLTGYRSLQYHKGSKQLSLRADWLLLILTFLLAGGFVSYMIWDEGLHLQGLQVVLMVFISILLALLLSDIRVLSRMQKLKKPDLLRRHIGRMGGAYISTLTAFMVTNVQTDPIFIAWLMPTVIGTPFIVYFLKKYTIRKKSVRQARNA